MSTELLLQPPLEQAAGVGRVRLLLRLRLVTVHVEMCPLHQTWAQSDRSSSYVYVSFPPLVAFLDDTSKIQVETGDIIF